MMPDTQPMFVLFDGVCNLCNGAVRWIISRDRRASFRFASLHSQAAIEILIGAGVRGSPPDSIVVVDRGHVHTQSDAVLAIASRLGCPWSLAVVGRVIPKVMRDGMYRFVASHRYRWFGRGDACAIPSPQTRSRFLDADERTYPEAAQDRGAG